MSIVVEGLLSFVYLMKNENSIYLLFGRVYFLIKRHTIRFMK